MVEKMEKRLAGQNSGSESRKSAPSSRKGRREVADRCKFVYSYNNKNKIGGHTLHY